jgi:hypothetical protein
VYNVTVEHEGVELNYEKLCAHWNSYCYDNDVLRMAYIIPNIVAGELNITYPIFFNPYNFEVSSFKLAILKQENNFELNLSLHLI